jgi:hypothetical protein
MNAPESWVETGLACVKGEATPRPYVMRFVEANELDAVYELHRLVVSGLAHPHVFRADSRSFMEQQIVKRGRTVGVFCDGAVVAYAAISFPDDDPDNLGRDLPLPDSELAHVADYDGSAVHPVYRGNGFQQMTTEVRHRYALQHRRWHILGTVSPLNPMSLSNFLALGCRVRNIKQKYGGMWRLIIHRDLRESMPPALEPASVLEVPLDDIAMLGLLLQQGYQGVRVLGSDPGTARLQMGFSSQPAERLRTAAA